MYTKEQLLKLLKTVADDKDHIIVGEEAYPAQCINRCINGFMEVTGGHLPGIVGFDLRKLPEDKDELRTWAEEISDYCKKDGIITLDHHYDNPSGHSIVVQEAGAISSDPYSGTLGTDHTESGYNSAFRELLTDGTDLNLEWRKQLDRDAEFLEMLQEKGVVVLWRPLHEMNSSSFWWGMEQVDKTKVYLDCLIFRKMWIYLYKYYTEVKKLHNLVWTFSTVYWSPEEAEQCYPGDEYVDIAGVDWYTERTDDLKEKGVLTRMNEFAKDKIKAICEFGPSGKGRIALNPADKGKLYTGEEMLNDLRYQKQTLGYRIAYVANWSRPWNLEFMGKGDVLMNSDFAMGNAEVSTLFKRLNEIESYGQKKEIE